MVLQTIWFFLWGLIWTLFFISDGFDFGVGILYPFLSKSERHKHLIIHSIEPIWNGNEVWLVTAVGITFAAFPLFYSVMFSSFYSPLMIILFALIFRGISIEFRRKISHKFWQKLWDIGIFIGSFIPAILFGIIFSNLFIGIPINQDGVYCGTYRTFLNPYGILGGILFLCLFIIHGALWLTLKTNGILKIKNEETIMKIFPILVILSVLFISATIILTDLYSNHIKYPILFFLLIEITISIFGIWYFLKKKKYFKSWISSCVTIMSFVFFGIIGLFPTLLKSSIHKNYDILLFNSTSSPLTLKIMLIVVAIFIPIVLGYQFWSYNLFKK